MKLKPDNARYKGDKVDVTAYLDDNGQNEENTDILSSARGTLIITNLDKSEVQQIPMEFINNQFITSFTLPDDKRYELKVKIEGTGFIRESEAKTLGAQNRNPVLNIKFHSIWLWNSKNKKIILSQYFTDPDKDKLKYSVLTETSNLYKAELTDDNLSIQAIKQGKGTITVICEDSKGGKTSVKIKVRIIYISYIFYGIICLILLTVLLILFRKLLGKVNKNTGYLKIEISDGSTGKLNKPFYKSLNSFKRSFSMQELFNLNPAFAELKEITVKTEKDGTITVINKSQSIIEYNGSVTDASKGFNMKNHNNIFIKTSNRRINIQYFSS